MAWTKQTGTKHREDCKRVFKLYDMNCRRCRELADGAKPRQGWNDQKIKDELLRLKAIREHDFSPNNPRHLGGVCTCFDW